MSLKRLKLREIRRLFRLIGEVRAIGDDPQQWRPMMIRQLQRIFGVQMVVSSEVHIRKSRDSGKMRIIDVGWGCDGDRNPWQIQSDRDSDQPEHYWILAGQNLAPTTALPGEHFVPAKPAKPMYGGSCFVMSQFGLPHIGAVDQLGLHRASGDEAFTHAEHRLIRIFHTELGRLWRKDALRRAKDPNADLSPRLVQTLDALLEGLSEKQIALKLELSQHTVHNYVKALHQRFEVNSRGELLAKAGKIRATFTPQLTIPEDTSRSL